MGRDEFQGVSEQFKAGLQRMDDARVLHQQGRWRGAMYLSGYSIECLLKVKLMRMFGCRRLGELEAPLIDRGLIAGDATWFWIEHNV